MKINMTRGFIRDGVLSSPLVAILLMSLAAIPAHSQCTDQALQLSQQQLYKTIGYISTSKFPQLTVPAANHWNADSAKDWSSGFFPGWIWYTYEQTLDSSLLSRAQAQTASLAGETTDATDLNVGFRILASYGTGYSVTRDPTYLSALKTGANTMASLYVSSAGVINSYPSYDPGRISVIIDNMPGLEILFFGAANGGNPAWYDMAVSHALKTAQNQVRADGSTYQGAEYNTDGSVYTYFTNDGASAGSTWSRGQAWGLYGFTVAYRYTKGDTSATSPAPTFLATAEKLANYFIANLPPDNVPVWDFTVPWTSNLGSPPRDSSAAAIASAALLELSTYVTDPTTQAYYYDAAINIQTSLSNPALYLANPTTTDGTLLHGTYSVPGNAGINTSLIWAEYYFPQSCFRAMSSPAQVSGLTNTNATSNQVGLAWTAESGPIRYYVKRSAVSGGPYAIIAPPPILTTNAYTDNSVTASSTYYYVVSAANAAGEGLDSAELAVTTPAPAPDFSVSASPSSVQLVEGGSAMSTITVGAIGGFSGVVTLSASSSPPGPSASFSPPSVTGPGSSVMTVTAPGVPAGNYTLTVPGTSGALVHSATVTVTVQPGGSFSIGANPASLTLSKSSKQSAASTITVASAGGFAGAVTLSASGLPKGVSAKLSPSSTVNVSPTMSGTATLTVSLNRKASTGTTTLKVSGNSNGLPSSTVSIKVQITN